jgi:hypothetical protein
MSRYRLSRTIDNLLDSRNCHRDLSCNPLSSEGRFWGDVDAAARPSVEVARLNEVMPGDTVAVYSRLVTRSSKRLHYLMFLVNESKGKLAAIFECMNAFRDLRVRKTAPFPPAILERIDAWLKRETNLDWPPPVSGSMQA